MFSLGSWGFNFFKKNFVFSFWWKSKNDQRILWIDWLTSSATEFPYPHVGLCLWQQRGQPALLYVSQANGKWARRASRQTLRSVLAEQQTPSLHTVETKASRSLSGWPKSSNRNEHFGQLSIREAIQSRGMLLALFICWHFINLEKVYLNSSVCSVVYT